MRFLHASQWHLLATVLLVADFFVECMQKTHDTPSAWH